MHSNSLKFNINMYLLSFVFQNIFFEISRLRELGNKAGKC